MVLTKNEQTRSEIVMGNIKRLFLSIPQKAGQTMTFDQGSEFADHRQIETNLNSRVYCCEAKSPWQKGTNENTNGRLRRYLPRDTDIASVTQDDLNQLARRLNRTPRKCLEYQTPREVFLQHCKKFDGFML